MDEFYIIFALDDNWAGRDHDNEVRCTNGTGPIWIDGEVFPPFYTDKTEQTGGNHRSHLRLQIQPVTWMCDPGIESC